MSLLADNVRAFDSMEDRNRHKYISAIHGSAQWQLFKNSTQASNEIISIYQGECVLSGVGGTLYIAFAEAMSIFSRFNLLYIPITHKFGVLWPHSYGKEWTNEKTCWKPEKSVLPLFRTEHGVYRFYTKFVSRRKDMHEYTAHVQIDTKTRVGALRAHTH